ncbi:MAG: hypothetical protein KDD45_08215, partial [Bdellovibrionales bacterium]|nr:hypothetical protein [Bdellovibrionales bacterium]
DYDDFVEVVDGGYDACGKLYSFIDFIDFEDVVACGVTSFDERLHVVVDFFSTEVDLDMWRNTCAARRRRISVDWRSVAICHKIY